MSLTEGALLALNAVLVAYMIYSRERERSFVKETTQILAARTLGEYANAKRKMLDRATNQPSDFDPGFGS